jgi:hypothetical protein
MGTSTANSGQNGKTPMVPSWLDENDDEDNNIIPAQADPDRFRNPRNNFTRYVNSGGRNRDNLHSATSQYVRESLGGTKNAVTRLGAARSSTARLVSVLGSISGQGIREASKEFGLGDLIGKNASDVFLEIMDFVCPDGGRTDEGIARSSYIETIESIPELNDTLIENMTENQFLIFTETYMTNVIQERLLNDIGNKTISLPDDVNTVEIIQEQLNDFIFGAVSDAMVQLNVEIKNIDSTQTRTIVDTIYEKAYSILASIEEV